MKKIYRILVLISFLLIIGIIIFFVLKINPKLKTRIYKSKNEYLIVLNTNKLDNKKTIVKVNNQDYETNLSIIHQQENLYLYYLSFLNSDIVLENDINAFIYLHNISLFKYLTSNF